jgi:WD40 repeat protein
MSQPGEETLALSWHIRSVKSMVFSSDGKTLASSSDDTRVILWHLDIDLEPNILMATALLLGSSLFAK